MDLLLQFLIQLIYQKDASCYWFGVTGASGLVQNHSLSKATETCKAGSAAVVVE